MIPHRFTGSNVVDALLAATAGMMATAVAIVIVAGAGGAPAPPPPPSPVPSTSPVVRQDEPPAGQSGRSKRHEQTANGDRGHRAPYDDRGFTGGRDDGQQESESPTHGDLVSGSDPYKDGDG